jgi:hypothetical protein
VPAQESEPDIAIEVAIPQDFGDGGDVTVQEQARRKCRALDANLTGSQFYPVVAANAGTTSGIFLTSRDDHVSPVLLQQGFGQSGPSLIQSSERKRVEASLAYQL